MSTQAFFLGELAGVSDPESAKVIGGPFVDVFKAEAAKLRAGTGGHKGDYLPFREPSLPDVIESGGYKSKKAVTIKSHHNVGGLPEQLGLKLLEPLRDLFKDGSARVGRSHGPTAPGWSATRFSLAAWVCVSWARVKEDARRPAAPVPALISSSEVAQLQGQSDRQTTGSDPLARPSTVFTARQRRPGGDGRWPPTVAWSPCALLQTSDFMTADWAELPPTLRWRCPAIIGRVRGISRVTCDGQQATAARHGPDQFFHL